MTPFETWMRSKLHFTHYGNGWFWHEHFRVFGEWPTAAERRRGREMREEYLKEMEKKDDQRTA